MTNTPLAQRSLARRAGVSRSFIQELHTAGLLNAQPTLEDVLVVQCMACVPLRWRRSPASRSSQTEPSPLLESLASRIRHYIRAGLPDSVIVVTDSAAEISPFSDAASRVAAGDTALLILPVAHWWAALVEEASLAT